ncbi:unnamed protein product [Rotaria socialis]|uniref:Proteasome activator PA28 C-terminal domain-containing protein n=1 Tax=Rotaria socialis TaxID=392032 RepID=A0A818YYL2_9BILA|nr:unnamed protein product [Rotaria socialis]CAF3644152.1 unnamed protein product [Rotaria socialis]CAF3762069.1 unnamed protein product [Rotaria socialis]CAF4490764.1 unnamed protein product [Rotaria socialis]CAF4631592.1 unnamed protein product [Rotaria socialis]
MDIDKNEKIFTELYTNIKQQAEKSLKSLVENAHDIENFLQTDIFSQNENTNLNLIIKIPSYSDSHDFSTVVQNEILDEIASMKTNCIAYMGQIVDYREQRALANKELFKRPQLDDNYHLIANLDYQLRRNLKIMLIEIKSYILRICNILTKNKDLIHRRQSSHYQHYF